MFFRKKDSRKGNGILGIFRILLSLTMITLLATGLLQAYRAFSGQQVLSSDLAYKLISDLLSFNPSFKIPEAGKILKNFNTPAPKPTAQFKFAVISDSHKDYQNLSKTLQQAKLAGAEFIVGLGDFSDTGTIEELRATKHEFDTAGLPYYVTAGDHDLWDARNKQLASDSNFKQVFGTPYQAFSYRNIRIVIFYDSDNYFGVDPLELNWLSEELDINKLQPGRLTFVFTSIPLYHPSSDHIMGKTNPKLKDQADHLVSILAKSGVAETIAGDTHSFLRYTEPSSNLKMTTVGAVTSSRNPQAPRFAMVDIYDDGSYNIEDVEIK